VRRLAPGAMGLVNRMLDARPRAKQLWLFLLAAILAATAALTKYFGVALVPLLAAYTLVRERGLTHRLLYLSVPVVVISSYQLITKAKYGQALFSAAMLFSWKETARPERHFFEHSTFPSLVVVWFPSHFMCLF